MSKHRKHRDYKNYDDLGSNNGSDNFGGLSSLLGNIDINQIASLLSSTGILNGLNSSNSNNNGEEKESITNILSNVDLGQLLSQATNLNSMINDNEIREEEHVDRRSRGKGSRERENIQLQGIGETQSGDSIVVLLNAIRPLVAPDKSEIIGRIVDLYVQGKI